MVRPLTCTLEFANGRGRCDAAFTAIEPPSTFLLPAPQTTLVAAPTRSDPDAQISRTTKWQWLDADWHVLPDHRATTPVVASSASTVDLSKAKSDASIGQPSAAALADWARNKANQASTNARKESQQQAHRRRASWAPFQGSEPHGEAPHDDGSSLPAGAMLEELGEWAADAEGWQYGDNAFEKMSNRAGMGKYTRRRAWQRRAHVVEETEVVSRAEGGLRARTAAVPAVE
jgi:hypothetical protein